MEEDNEQIRGWDYDQINILDSKQTAKMLKKQFKLLQEDQQKSVRLKPSNILPVIKNTKNTTNDNKDSSKDQKYQQNDLIRRNYNEKNSINSIIQNKKRLQYILRKCLNNNTSSNTVEQTEYTYGLQYESVHEEQKKLSVHKKQKLKKQSSLMVKIQQISNIQKLKINAKQYCSTPKMNCSFEDTQKSKQLLKKLHKNSKKGLNKKEKGKYFIVRKQKISPQKKSEDVSKIAVMSQNSQHKNSQRAIQQKKKNLLKQKCKHIIDAIQIQRKNSCNLLSSSKTQMLRKASHQRRNTNIQNNQSTSKFQLLEDIRVNAWKESAFVGNTVSREQKNNQKYIRKWDKVLKQVQNISRNVKMMKQCKSHQKGNMKSQVIFHFIDKKYLENSQVKRHYQMTEHQGVLLNKKMPAALFRNPSDIMILKSALRDEERSHQFIRENRKRLATQAESIGYEQFNDECLFKNNNVL